MNRAGSGVVLDDLSSDSIERAVDFVAQGVPEPDVLMRPRLVTEKHFSLDSGASGTTRCFDVLAD